MDFSKVGILEIGEERIEFRPLSIDRFSDGNTILKAELLNLFNESNARRKAKTQPSIKRVIFNNPVTIVIWSDDTKTIVKCQPGDTYSEELGLAMCISKKYLGNKGNFNEVFKKWIPDNAEEKDSTYMKNMIKKFCSYTPCTKCPIYALPRRNSPDVGCYANVGDKVLIENYNAIKNLVKEV